MKRIITIVVVLLAICAPESATAQSFADRLHFELAAGTGTKSKGIEPIDLSAKVGVEIIPHLYAFASTGEHQFFLRFFRFSFLSFYPDMQWGYALD